MNTKTRYVKIVIIILLSIMILPLGIFVAGYLSGFNKANKQLKQKSEIVNRIDYITEREQLEENYTDNQIVD